MRMLGGLISSEKFIFNKLQLARFRELIERKVKMLKKFKNDSIKSKWKKNLFGNIIYIYIYYTSN